MEIKAHKLGRESQLILQIDNCAADAETLRETAISSPMRPIGPHYPGVRAVVPTEMATALYDPAKSLIAEHFSQDPPRLAEAYFSLVTTRRTALTPVQRMPHFDGTDPRAIAVLLFLGHGEQGGTAFYRQCSTGFEAVTENCLQSYNAALRADVAANGLPPSDYIDGDTPLFERVALCPAAFNRALIYRGNVLHSGHIPPEVDLSPDPRRGRLSINLFCYD